MNVVLVSRVVRLGGYGSLEGARTSYTSSEPLSGERILLLQVDWAREQVEAVPVL